MDHFDSQLQCNAVLFLLVWHKIEVQFYYLLNMVVACHKSSCDWSTSMFVVHSLMLTAVLNARRIERATSIRPIVQLWLIVDNSKISSTLIIWSKCRTSSFAWWKSCDFFTLHWLQFDKGWRLKHFLFNE